MHVCAYSRILAALVLACLLAPWIATAAHGRALERLPDPDVGPSFPTQETLPPPSSSLPYQSAPATTTNQSLFPDSSGWGTECCDGCDPNHPSAGLPWCWQWLPDGLVWR